MSNRFDKYHIAPRKPEPRLGLGAIVLCVGVLLVACGDASGGRHTELELDEVTLKQIYYPPLDRMILGAGTEADWSAKGAEFGGFDGLAFTVNGELLVELHHRSGLSEIVGSNLRKRRIRLVSVVPSLDKMTIAVKNVNQLHQLGLVNGVTLLAPAKAALATPE